MFKVLAPIRNLEETKVFIKEWITEFYWWVIFDWLWRTNARPHWEVSNFINILELEKSIKLIHVKWWRFSLTLNKKRFDLDDFSKIYKLISHLNIDSFIVWDILLLNLLNKLKIKEKVHISTLLWIINIEWFNFFENLFPNINFNRFCLERAIDKEMLLNISNKFKWKELEFFIFNWRCKFIEWWCWIANFIDKENIVKEKFECWCKIDACKLLKTENTLNIAFQKMACWLCVLNKLPIDKNIDFILKIAWRSGTIEDNIKYVLGINKIIKINNIKISTDLDMKKVYKELNWYDCSNKECMYK